MNLGLLKTIFPVRFCSSRSQIYVNSPTDGILVTLWMLSNKIFFIEMYLDWLDTCLYFIEYQPYWWFNTKSVFMKIFRFQRIQFGISIRFNSKNSWIGKTFLFQAIQLSEAVLIQLIQFITSTDFLYTRLNIKTVVH